MLGLTLRQEFRGRRLKGTAIELKNDKKTGATQVDAADFLNITYPSADVIKAIQSVGPEQARPVVLIGERGQGKSHIMAVICHLLNNPAAVRGWLNEWSDRLGDSDFKSLPLRDGMQVVSESLHRQNYKFLWDLLFDQHPKGNYYLGKWQGMGEKKTDIPSDTLLLDMFREQPIALILDEYQTWFDGLTNTKQYPWRNWAFNFIQILSEIAKEYPELLVLAVSVRNGATDAFQQIQRINPELVDFQGPNAKTDRQRLLLHRLFENRINVPEDDIQPLIEAHISEYFRLMDVSQVEHEKVREDFMEAWPFAPHLLRILDDQVLISTHAQETRDLIRILAALYKRNGDKTPILTASDFRLDDDGSGVNALLSSVSDQHLAKLREKAQRNLDAVIEAVRKPADVPHVDEIIGSLWIRSLAMGNHAGARPEAIQVDITRDAPIDDNAFKVELDLVVENSFNIHLVGDRLIFKQEENPQAKLLANARNDKLFSDQSDIDQLAREIRAVIGGKDDVAKMFRVIVLRKGWTTAPWAALPEEEHPDRWDDRIPLLVLPEAPDKPNERLGKWLKNHLDKGRNTVRFILPRVGDLPVFADRNLLVLSRAIVLGQKWGRDQAEYKRLAKKYENELQTILKKRFDRFAILDTWNNQFPDRCEFQINAHKAQGGAIPEAVDAHIRENLFIPEDFEDLVLKHAAGNETVGKLFKELREPRPNQEPCISWLGETLAKEKLLRMCARGRIAINLRGMEYLQTEDGEDEETAWKRMRGRLGTGKHLNETNILLPQAVPQTDGVTTPEKDEVQTPQDNGGKDVVDYTGGGSGGLTNTGVGEGDGGDSIFVGDAKTATNYTSPPTSALNLLGQIEKWGVKPGTQLQDLSIKIDKLTGAQANNLLKALPDGMTFALELKKEED